MGNINIQTCLGRITHQSFGNAKPFDVIFQTLKGERPTKERNYVYHYKNVQIYKKKMEVIYGEIYKSKLGSEHILFNKDNLTYKNELFDELFYTSRFVIFKNDLSIVFTYSNKFDEQFFIKTFEKLYQLNTLDTFSSIRIHYQREEKDLYDKIHSFTKLLEVELIDIRKSNPCPSYLSKRIEALLSEEHTDVLCATFTSEGDSGLSRNDDSLIISGVAAAINGYGETTIAGVNPDGSFERIKSTDNIIRKSIKKSTDTEDFVNHVIVDYEDYIHTEADF